MKIEITKKVDQVEIIEVELPYYYEHDLSGDRGEESIIYGKITEQECTSIHQKAYHDRISYEIEINTYPSIKQSGMSGYFGKDYKSSKGEYEAVKLRCKEFFERV